MQLLVIIHLLTGYEGYSTFIVPKVPTIFRDNAGDNSWYRADNASAIHKRLNLFDAYFVQAYKYRNINLSKMAAKLAEKLGVAR